MNVQLHFGIFYNVVLNISVMLWNAFCIISSLLQKLIYGNIYEEMNVLLHFGISYNVLLNRSIMLWNAFCIISSWLQKLTYSNIYQKMNVLLRLLNVLLRLFHQVIGIPMRTNCAPLLSDPLR